MKKTKQEVVIKYYGDTDDPMYQTEIEVLFPWLNGKGVDIGCGGRSISKEVIRVDIDPLVKPDILSRGDELPFGEGEFDYLISTHSFEHFEDQVKTLKEWLRVIKTGGIIAIVHPDLTYTKKQLEPAENPSLKGNPFNKHFHEHTHDSFIEMIHTWTDIPFRIIDSGVACPGWSFYVILKKTG